MKSIERKQSNVYEVLEYYDWQFKNFYKFSFTFLRSQDTEEEVYQNQQNL